MPISGRSQAGSGIDRALQQALNAGLDETLESGELYPGERDKYPDPVGDYDPDARPWQMPMSTRREPPASDEPLGKVVAGLRRRSMRPPREEAARAQQESGTKAPPPDAILDARPTRSDRARTDALGRIGRLLVTLLALAGFGPRGDEAAGGETIKRKVAGERVVAEAREKDAQFAMRNLLKREGAPSEAERFKETFRFRDELTGVVMVHGIGPQLAGQTLLDWTRPIITLIGDACASDPGLVRLDADARRPPGVSDPVFKSNIDFSGETFPVVQLRIPRRNDVPAGDPRGVERRWIVTETWWASEVRPPTLRTMIGWLGEQGGVGRIVQGIQENILGRGIVGKIAQVSLQAFISVIVSFVLLVFLVLLGISRLIPFGPLRNAVTLRLAASFITDWFGGARTLLRDPAQSANVRGRLVATIKALRAYGCRHVVIVAHSGGTMVSLMTLTDPAYPRLQVEKLITIGEALNLGWRLEDANPDMKPATPPVGNRMRGDLAKHQKNLKWRDFWSTHDPAPSGWPRLPKGMSDPGAPRFTAERVYNRMSIGEDHGGYWDNDEHFLMPLIREIDAATGDRGGSRFYSDKAESEVRARRKERVGLLALWRRGIAALPVMAILAAALLTSGGLVHGAGDLALSVFGLMPGNEAFGTAASTLAANGSVRVVDWFPPWTWQRWYELGVITMGIVFLLLLTMALVPGRTDRLWLGRPISRIVLFVVDVAIGIGAFLAIVGAWLLGVGRSAATDQAAIDVLRTSGVGLVLLIGGFWGLGHIGRWTRARIIGLQGRRGLRNRAARDILIVLSAAFLGVFLLLLLAVVVAVVLVFAGNSAAAHADDTRRFILGAIVLLLGFQLLGRLGTWRWDSWDIRERRALRRRPTTYPFRYWTYILLTMLATAAVAAALIAALGLESELLRLGIFILLIVVLSVGKDVVDNDIDTGEGGGGAGDSGGSAPIMPAPPSGPPPGATAA